MKTVYHIQAGAFDWTPTDVELRKIAQDFKVTDVEIYKQHQRLKLNLLFLDDNEYLMYCGLVYEDSKSLDKGVFERYINDITLVIATRRGVTIRPSSKRSAEDTMTEPLIETVAIRESSADSQESKLDLEVKTENSGGDVDYYTVDIRFPKRFNPGKVECEDVIKALDMRFDEGEAFKAIWRAAASRAFKKMKAGDSNVRNAEKVVHYGKSMLDRYTKGY